MDFTEIFKQSGGLVAFSPGAHFLLTAVADRVIIRRADTFQISRSWAIDPSPSASTSAQALPSSLSTNNRASRSQKVVELSLPIETPAITHLEWSSDSEFVLAACARAGVVHVFRMSDERWYMRVEAGAEGLIKAEWAPDGRHIVCFSEWGVRKHVSLAPIRNTHSQVLHVQLRVTIWSLVTSAATYIQYPLHPDRGT